MFGLKKKKVEDTKIEEKKAEIMVDMTEEIATHKMYMDLCKRHTDLQDKHIKLLKDHRETLEKLLELETRGQS